MSRSPCRWLAVCLVPLALGAGGCARWHQTAMYPNPMPVPTRDPECLWNTIIDVVDDDFRVEREQRVRRLGDVLTEGRVDTLPQSSATFLEIGRRDVATPYDRLESTLQSMRRRAVVRVIPDPDGYLLDVAVYKELEDTRPEYSPTPAATFRTDTSLSRYTDPVGEQAAPLGWIAQGRDTAMEQKIITKIVKQMGGPPPDGLGSPMPPPNAFVR